MNFSENFESFKGMAANAANVAKKKAVVLAGIAKANVSIYAEEDKVRKAEAELGKLYYNDYVSGNSPDLEAYRPICERITDSKSVIADLKETIANLRTESGEGEPISDDEVTDADFVVSEEDFVDVEVVDEPKTPFVVLPTQDGADGEENPEA